MARQGYLRPAVGCDSGYVCGVDMTVQDALDFLYVLGCQYDIAEQHMRILCKQFGVSYQDLLNYNGVAA